MTTPTPGQPLSEADVSLLKKGDLLRDPYDISWFEFSQDGWVCALDAKGVRMGFQPKHVTFLGRPDQDGWIAWSGGENPVPGVMVEARFADRTVSEALDSESFDWQPCDVPEVALAYTIIAYRPHAPVSRPGDGVEGERIDYLRRSRDGHARNAHAEFEKRVMATEALISAREALHQHYVDWDGEPEDAVPLQEARDECDRVLDAIAALTPPAEPVSRPAGGGEREAVAILKGIGKIDGDGWKDTTTKGEVVYVWNAEKPSPYAPGQYPRIGNEGWSASTSQYDFTPATADDVPAILALIRPAAPGGGEAWAWLAAHPSMELGHCYGDEDDDPAWQVHERSGNRSDREWRLVASGPTPLEAVLAAIPASEGGEG